MGAANRVTFDPQTKEFIIIRRRNALGPEFRLLGVLFDAQLLMHKGVRKIAVEAGWRLKSILRPRAYFTTPELMRLYKAHILSCIESGVAKYFHACDSTLACVDRVQGRFLRAVGLTEEENAPLLEKCRDLGLWGLDVPESYGGANLPNVALIAVNEEIGRTCVPFTFPPDSPNLHMLMAVADDEQKEKYLKPYVAGTAQRIEALMDFDLLYDGRTVFGDPAHAKACLQPAIDAGVTEVNFVTILPGLSQDKILASLRLFAAEVMPHFR